MMPSKRFRAVVDRCFASDTRAKRLAIEAHEQQPDVIALARGDVACPVKALRAWLQAAAIESGAIFRPIGKASKLRSGRLTDRSVANIVKAYAARAGLDATVFSGHSLRSRFLTSAAANGASIFKMMDVSRHKSVDTLRGYVRDAELFKDHAVTGLLSAPVPVMDLGSREVNSAAAFRRRQVSP